MRRSVKEVWTEGSEYSDEELLQEIEWARDRVERETQYLIDLVEEAQKRGVGPTLKRYEQDAE